MKRPTLVPKNFKGSDSIGSMMRAVKYVVHLLVTVWKTFLNKDNIF